MRIINRQWLALHAQVFILLFFHGPPAHGQAETDSGSNDRSKIELLFEADRAVRFAQSRSENSFFFETSSGTSNAVNALKAGGLAAIARGNLAAFDGETIAELRDFLFNCSQRSLNGSIRLISNYKQKRPNHISLSGEPISQSTTDGYLWPMGYDDSTIYQIDVCFEFQLKERKRTPSKAFIYGMKPEGAFGPENIDPEIHEVFRITTSFLANHVFAEDAEDENAKINDLSFGYATAIWKLEQAKDLPEDVAYWESKVQWFRNTSTSSEKQKAKSLLLTYKQRQRQRAKTFLSNAEEFGDDGTVQAARKLHTETIRQIENAYQKELQLIDSVGSRIAEEVAFVENECSKKNTDETESARNAAKSIGSMNLLVNGKEFKIEVFDWDRDGATIRPDPQNQFIKVYLPKDGGYYDRGASFANELGNIIAETRDGQFDGLNMARNGARIGPLGAEAESDRYSQHWAEYQLRLPDAVFPFTDNMPNDKASIDFIKGLLDKPEKRLTPPGGSLLSVSPLIRDFERVRGWRQKVEGYQDFYRKRASAMEKAEEMVKEGKLKEAYNMLLTTEAKNYACGVLNSHKALAAP